GDAYAALVRTIVYQQLAGAAAAAIHGRLLALYGDGPAGRAPEPEELLATEDSDLRAAGLSGPKIGYLRDLASHVSEGRLDFDGIDDLDAADVVARLTAVKGIGEWSAHMFLMFQLGRPDILPVGDLGVRKGMVAAYGLRKLPSPRRMHEIGRQWAPYRSVGSWYMWRAVETVTPD
ncbi:MAG: DNA-3-methyladenine glycosylase 2 family protein, partial [Akkermansiaceae bacterium]